MIRGGKLAAFVAATSGWACGSFDAAPAVDAGAITPGDAGADGAATDAGPTPTPSAGPVLLYTFTEGAGSSVKDVSGVQPALDLVIDDPTATSWSAAGLTLLGAGTRVSSVVAATKLDSACVAKGFTAEVWVRPDKTLYDGPARLLTHSPDTVETRFFIGAGREASAMAGDRWVLRVGSTTGNVGLESTGALTTALQHVVAVGRPGADALLYVDGSARGTAPLPGALAWAPAPLVLGGEPGVADRRFTGTYSRVAIHCRAFSADEVRAAYQVGSGH